MARLKTVEYFVTEARKVHGDKYDYSKVVYANTKTNVTIICPIHGEFEQTPMKHLEGHGCHTCSQTRRVNKKTIPLEERIALINENCKRKNITFNGFCNNKGEKCEYKSYKTYLHLKCNICGKEWTSTNYDNFVNKDTKCRFCQAKKRNEFNTSKHEEVVEAICKKLPNDVEFVYLCDSNGKETSYSKARNIYVLLRCKKCNSMWITKYFKFNTNCPKCYGYKLEKEIFNLLNINSIEFETHKRYDFLKGLSLDFFIPSKNIAIECQGIQHFISVPFFGGDEKFNELLERDRLKRELCEINGIKLLYFSKLKICFPYKVYTDETELLTEILK